MKSDDPVTDLLTEAFVHARARHGVGSQALLEEVVTCLSTVLRDITANNLSARYQVDHILAGMRERRGAAPLVLKKGFLED